MSFPTSLGTSTADEIRLLGQDLTADLMGKVGFGELAFWLVALRRPTPSETREPFDPDSADSAVGAAFSSARTWRALFFAICASTSAVRRRSSAMAASRVASGTSSSAAVWAGGGGVAGGGTSSAGSVTVDAISGLLPTPHRVSPVRSSPSR